VSAGGQVLGGERWRCGGDRAGFGLGYKFFFVTVAHILPRTSSSSPTHSRREGRTLGSSGHSGLRAFVLSGCRAVGDSRIRALGSADKLAPGRGPAPAPAQCQTVSV